MKKQHTGGVNCWLLLLGALALGGCARDNPDYCADDSACTDPAAPHCHGQGHFCYEGCESDADCADPGKPWHMPDRAICDLATHDCVGTGGGDRENGESCSSGTQCASGNCVDDVCCDSTCTGTCKACDVAGQLGSCVLVPAGQDTRGDCAGSHEKCGGSCDGQGACAFATTSVECRPPSCSNDALTTSHCDGLGACASKTDPCGGYRCDDAGTACKSSCQSAADCTGAAECIEGLCVDELPLGEPCGTNNAACLSGYCVDGVCCSVPSCGECLTCVNPADPGSCKDVEAGPAPTGDCPGAPACGAGQCDGAGSCAYKPLDAECGASCAADTETISTCDPSHACVQGSPSPCAPFVCDGNVRCHSGCTDLQQCVANGACDRSEAHVTGAGTCIAAAQVAAVSSGSLQAAINSALAATPPKTHLVVTGGPYAEQITLTAGKLTLVGIGLPAISPPGQGGSAVTISGSGTELTLQGLEIYNADGDGVSCIGGAPVATLVVLESTIRNNKDQGIEGYKCNVTLRRNKIQDNPKGGVLLASGNYTVVNNLVTDNGQTSTSVDGGLTLNPSSASGNLFLHNTVAYNGGSHIALGSAVKCGANIDLHNSVLYFSGSTSIFGCTPKFSDVEGTTSGVDGNIADDPLFGSVLAGDFTLQPGSPCVDAGQDAITGITLPAIDLAGNARQVAKKSSVPKVDIGAYEVQ
jgi:hypothetical protein